MANLRPDTGRLYYPGFWLALLCALVVLAGCSTTSRPIFSDTAGPGWSVRQGQAVWRPNSRLPELAGEVVMASHPDGAFSLEFSKTPFSLVRAQTTRTNWFIQFPPQHISLRGRGAPLTRFAWLQLPAALTGQPLPRTLHFDNKPDGGWRLVNTRSGETIEGFFTP